jgi:histidine phosphotransfer protein HptB
MMINQNAVPVLDQAALNSLKEVMEDDFVFLVETFLADSSERISKLGSIIESGDADAIRRSAHSFKGSCGNLGAMQLAKLCEQLEHKGLKGELIGVSSDLTNIEEAFLIVERQLKAYIA